MLRIVSRGAQRFQWFCEYHQHRRVIENRRSNFSIFPVCRADFRKSENSGDGKFRKKFAERVEVDVGSIVERHPTRDAVENNRGPGCAARERTVDPLEHVFETSPRRFRIALAE